MGIVASDDAEGQLSDPLSDQFFKVCKNFIKQMLLLVIYLGLCLTQYTLVATAARNTFIFEEVTVDRKGAFVSNVKAEVFCLMRLGLAFQAVLFLFYPSFSLTNVVCM